jgi:hypothetical protein
MSNSIWELNREDGYLVHTFEGLASMGVEHFQAIFKAQEGTSITEIVQIAQLFPRFVEEEDNRMLIEKFSLEKLFETLHHFQKDKVRDPRFGLLNFILVSMSSWGDILRVVEESRDSGHIHDPINVTFITLIPKYNHPTSFDEFRPISLCNLLYKIVSKVIAIRVKEVLLRTIFNEQFGFLEGRQIHKEIGVA